MVLHIPVKWISCTARAHPWVDEECEEAIEAKCKAFGTEQFAEAERRCTRVLNRSFFMYQDTLRADISKLPIGAKRWWRYNRELLHRKSQSCTIPPLKVDNRWFFDAKAKADAFAQVFAHKSTLPRKVVDIEFADANVAMAEFILIRTRWVRRILKQLKEGKATGPDGIPGKVLKRYARRLAPVIARFARLILQQRRWPQIWKHHSIHALYKKKCLRCRELQGSAPYVNSF